METRDCVEAKVEEAKASPSAIGPAFTFHRHVEKALWPQRDSDWQSDMWSLKNRLQRAGEQAPVLGEDGFDSFLADHPELGGSHA
jgi:hypothetical protein